MNPWKKPKYFSQAVIGWKGKDIKKAHCGLAVTMDNYMDIRLPIKAALDGWVGEMKVGTKNTFTSTLYTGWLRLENLVQNVENLVQMQLYCVC